MKKTLQYERLCTYNHAHNVLRFLDNLPTLSFTTSEMKRDY